MALMAPTAAELNDVEAGCISQPSSELYSVQWSEQLLSDPQALELVAQEGWDAFPVIASGASGPRAFANMGFDIALLNLMRSGSLTRPKWFLGGSTGALRSCALLSSSLLPDTIFVTEALKEHFVGMVYRPGDTPETLAPMMAGLYEKVLPRELVYQALHHPSWHLAIMVTQILPPYADLPPWQLKAMFWCFLGANFVLPEVLSQFQRRLCFYSGDQAPPFISPEDNVTCVPLTPSNVYQVLQATTCLPFISPHCEHIDGVGRGLFVDGAFNNYHLNLPSSEHYPVLLLGDGPGPDFKQTIWDAYVPYRSASPAFRRHVSVVYPTQSFVQMLPSRCLPNTFDYFKDAYIRQPQLRHEHWRTCFDLSVQHFPTHPADLIAAMGAAAQPLPESGDAPQPLPLPRAPSMVQVVGLFSGGTWPRLGAVVLGRSASTGHLRSRVFSSGGGAGAATCDGGGGGAGGVHVLAPAGVRRIASECAVDGGGLASHAERIMAGTMLGATGLDAWLRQRAAGVQTAVSELVAGVAQCFLGRGKRHAASSAGSMLMRRSSSCTAAISALEGPCAGAGRRPVRTGSSGGGAGAAWSALAWGSWGTQTQQHASVGYTAAAPGQQGLPIQSTGACSSHAQLRAGSSGCSGPGEGWACEGHAVVVTEFTEKPLAPPPGWQSKGGSGPRRAYADSGAAGSCRVHLLAELEVKQTEGLESEASDNQWEEGKSGGVGMWLPAQQGQEASWGSEEGVGLEESAVGALGQQPLLPMLATRSTGASGMVRRGLT